MQRIMCKSKIHRAHITQAELYYEGSLTLDTALMDAAGMIPYERVQIVNVNNGSRFETYLIPGKRNSGVVCLNGAAARLVSKNDLIIIASHTYIDENQTVPEPKIVFVDINNHPA